MGRLLSVCLLAAIAVSGCGKAKKKPDRAAPTATESTQFQDASRRLTGEFLDGGWVVSRKPDGSPDHQGEGILWSGVAMAALSCADGTVIEDNLTATIDRLGGALVRIEPLGEYEGGREISVDGAIGLYRGVAHRLKCPGSAEKWKPVVAKHLAYLAANGNRLNAAAPAKLEDEYLGVKVDFSYPLDLVAAKLGLQDEPDEKRARTLEREDAAWAEIVNLKHAPAYRVNLGFLTLETLEDLGENISQSGRNDFCAATRGVQIATVDEWCGRGGLRDWIANFQFDRFEFAFQRSGSWEEPDGNGERTPGLDLLVALRQFYDLPN